MVWSKLQKDIYKLLLIKDLKIQIQCNAYRSRSSRKSTGNESCIPRYWITKEKEIIWDYPRNELAVKPRGKVYPKLFTHTGTVIGHLLREYIDTPIDNLLEKDFKEDVCGLTEILKACDRRIGKRKLPLLMLRLTNDQAISIVQERLNSRELIRLNNQ